MNNKHDSGMIVAVALLLIGLVLYANVAFYAHPNSAKTQTAYLFDAANLTNGTASNNTSGNSTSYTATSPSQDTAAANNSTTTTIIQAAPLTIQDPYAIIRNRNATSTTASRGSGTRIIILDNGASGGTPPYTYQWLESYNGGSLAPATSCGKGDNASVNKVTPCVVVVTKAMTQGKYLFNLSVTDASGQTVIDPGFELNVVTNLTLSTGLIINFGSSIATGTASGGSGTYNITWTINGTYENGTDTACTLIFNDDGNTTGASSINLTKGQLYSSPGCSYVLSDGLYNVKFTAADAENLSDSSSSNALLDVDWYGGINANPRTINALGTSNVTVKWDTGNTAPFTVKLYSSTTAATCENSGHTEPGSSAAYVTEDNGISETSRTASFSVSPTSNTFYCGEIIDSAGANEMTTNDSDYASEGYNEITEVAVNIPALAVSINVPKANPYILDINQTEPAITAKITGGTGTYAWQWYENSAKISGATGTNSTPTFTFATKAGSQGPYSLYVSVTSGSATANTPAVNTIVNKALRPPLDPELTNGDVSVDQGQTPILETALGETIDNGTAPYNYVWYVGYNSSGDSNNNPPYIPATTSLCLTPKGGPAYNVSIFCEFATTTSTPTGTYEYKVGINDSATVPETANTATPACEKNCQYVTVHTQLERPAITPSSGSLEIGQTEILTATAAGGSGLYGYQWYINGNPVGTDSNTFTFQANATTLAGSVDSVTVNVTDEGVSTQISNVSTYDEVTVVPAVHFGTPSITIKNATIDAGQTSTLTANIVGGIAPYTFVWKLGAKTLGGSGDALTFNGNSSTLGADKINVTVHDSTGQSAATNGTVQVNRAFNSSDVAISPKSSTVDTGQSVTFTNTTTGGTAPYNYSYSFNPSIGVTQAGNKFSFVSAGNYTVTLSVKDARDVSASSSASVRVDAALTNSSVGVSLSNATADVGQSSLLTTTVSGGTGPYGYVWSLGNTILGGNSSTLIFNGNASTMGTDHVKVKVTDSKGTSGSGAGTVTINSAPSFGAPAVSVSNATIDTGQSATLVANAVGGTEPYTYKWTIEAKTLGSTATTLVFNGNSSTIGTDHINVTATDARGKGASAYGAVQVNQALANSSISMRVSNATIDAGQTSLLTASVSGGTAPYSYAWKLGNKTLGGNAATLVFNGNSSTLGTDHITVKVTDSRSTSGYATNTVTVNRALNSSGVSLLPQSSIVDAGQSITFANTTTGGTAPYTYAYTTGIVMENSTVYVGHNTTDGPFTIALTDLGQPNGNGISPAAVDILYDGVLTNTSQAYPGTTMRFNVSGEYLSVYVNQTFAGLYAYQKWAKFAIYVGQGGGVAQTGNKFKFSEQGNYTVTLHTGDARGENGQATATVQVNAALNNGDTGVSITNATIDVGQTSLVSATVLGGTAPYVYRWTLGNTVLGENSPTLLFSGNSSTLGTDHIKLSVTDSRGQSASDNGTVQVNTDPGLGNPTITVNNATIDVGQTALLAVNVIGGTGPYTYKWILGNTLDIIGTNSTLVFHGNSTTLAQSPDDISIDVIDSRNVGAATATSVQVNSKFGDSDITLSPGSADLDAGQNVTFTNTTYGGTAPYTYTYTFSPTNGVTRNGNKFSFDQSGNYVITLKVKDARGESGKATSDIYVDSAFNNSDVAVNPYNAVLDVGQFVVLNSSVTGGTAPYHYQWYNYSANALVLISGATSASYNVTGGAFGNFTYVLKVTDSATLPVTAQSVAYVEVNPIPTVVITPTKLHINRGQVVNFTATAFGGTPPFSYAWSYIPIINSTNGTTINLVSCYSPKTYSRAVYCSYGPYYPGYMIVTVNDSAPIDPSNSATSLTINITNSTPAASMYPSLEPITTGQTETYTINVTGGVGPFAVELFNVTGNKKQGANAIIPVGGGTNTISFAANDIGNFVYEAIVNDLGTYPADSFNTIPNTISVLPYKNISVGSLGLSISNGLIDSGQNMTISANIIGGVTPYTYIWTLKGAPIGTNSSVLTFHGNASTLANSPDLISLEIIDGFGKTAYGNAVVYVNPALKFGTSPISASLNSTLSIGQNTTLTANVMGGTGPYTFTWYLNGSPVGTNSSTFVVDANSTTQASSPDTVTVVVTDALGESISTSGTVSIAQPPSTGGSGGSTGGGGGGGGGGGNFLPTLLREPGCETILNFTTGNQEAISISNSSFLVVENFISPSSAGVSVNGQTYTINNGQTISEQYGNVNYTLELKNLSYLPILHEISLELCVAAPSSVQSNQSVTANQSTAGQGGSGTLGQGGRVAILQFVKQCANSTYAATYGCTTEAQVVSAGSQLGARLYLNGVELGSTNDTISDVENKPGTYTYVFNTTGNANYDSNSITYTYTVSSNGQQSGTSPLASLLSAPLPISLGVLLAILIGFIVAGRRRRRKDEES